MHFGNCVYQALYFFSGRDRGSTTAPYAFHLPRKQWRRNQLRTSLGQAQYCLSNKDLHFEETAGKIRKSHYENHNLKENHYLRTRDISPENNNNSSKVALVLIQ